MRNQTSGSATLDRRLVDRHIWGAVLHGEERRVGDDIPAFGLHRFSC